MPKGSMAKYSVQLETAKNRYRLLLKDFNVKAKQEYADLNDDNQNNCIPAFEQNDKILTAHKEYFIALRKYRLAYDKILNSSNGLTVNLTKERNREIIKEALQYWEGNRIINHAWCIMSNHIHWVFTVNKVDKENHPIFLQDVLHSVKLHTAGMINKVENRSGQLWERESFDTTLRDWRHFYNAMDYTLQNPVSAGLVMNWEDWPGAWICEKWKSYYRSEGS